MEDTASRVLDLLEGAQKTCLQARDTLVHALLTFVLVPLMRALAIVVRPLPERLQLDVKARESDLVAWLTPRGPYDGPRLGETFPANVELTCLDGRAMTWGQLLNAGVLAATAAGAAKPPAVRPRAERGVASEAAPPAAPSSSSLIVVNCGSYTCLSFRMRVRGVEEAVLDGAYPGLREAERPRLLHLYVREAAPSDDMVRSLDPSNDHRDGVCIAQPVNMAERLAAARAMQQHYGLRAPVACDAMDDGLDDFLAASPDRLYVLSRDGRVVWKAAHGPSGPALHSLTQLESFLRTSPLVCAAPAS